ncbi:class V lanthionine synthetase subunit LxmK [Crossiella sp. SN42]|uniref:class V lanthionine synthetase subunit LxmK n=1 Tax=Crossiella sp. SN42 TaxID=2944808 RepID=UPI00207D2350|nr:class V lanthionine synthetase subunit LxmK [Crossiella sp. SN42]MCO1580508.1 class V lanthionine synthetase subunit LxmK [Crossiella sp. SN42]
MATGSPRIAPRELAAVPEVNTLLRALGLGVLRTEDCETFPGRNDNWAGTTSAGHPVFVKKLAEHNGSPAARLRRTLAFQRLVEQRPQPRLATVRCHGWDEQHGLVVFERIPDARSGAELMVEESFGPDLGRAAGQAIGTVHGNHIPAGLELDTSTPPMPSAELLHGLPAEVFDQSSHAELACWRLLQRDPDLAAAIRRLLEAEAAAPRVPAHCDLRLDQFLLRGNTLHLTDWEEFRLADPARDLGSFTGEWLYRSILDIVTTRGDTGVPGETAFADLTLTPAEVISRGVRKFERLRPVVVAFWTGYRESRPVSDAGLAARAAGFAGWHLWDRLIAGAALSPQLGAVARAAAGVGRTVLLSPESYVDTLGLGERA